MNKLEGEIIKALTPIPAKAKLNNWHKKTLPWTTEIKNQLCRIGKEHGWQCYSNRCEESTCKQEWLYDVVWWKVDSDDFGISMPLAAEIEWAVADREGDFEKLVQSRAELRLWITHGNTESLLEHFKKCEDIISRFEASILGDRYLFVGFPFDNDRIEVKHYIHEPQDIGKPT